LRIGELIQVLGAIGRGLGAELHDAREGGVGADLEHVLTDRFPEAARDVEAVERQDAAQVGVDEEDARVVVCVRHGEDPTAVAVE
jgi:hypothetical protein